MVQVLPELQEDKASKGLKVLEVQVCQVPKEHQGRHLQVHLVRRELQEVQVLKELKVPKVRLVLQVPLVHLTLDLRKILNLSSPHFRKYLTLEG